MPHAEPPPPDAARSPGADVTVAALDADPYPVYARLQREAPICRIESLGLWYVTRYEDVRAIALDDARFTPGFVRQACEAGIRAAATRLIDEFRARGEIELRRPWPAAQPIATAIDSPSALATDESKVPISQPSSSE